MGFFKDFKEDLSQAVNEMVTDPTSDMKDEDVMVNTLDDAELSGLAENIQKEALNSIDDSILDYNSADTNNDSYNEVSEEKSEVEEVEDSIVQDEQEEQDVIEETAVITKCLTVHGDLDSKGSIDLFGFVEGNVSCKGKLTVSGVIVGDSKADEVFANNAQIDGNIDAQGSVKIGQGSVIVGNITATSAVIAGAVKGNIDIQGPVIIDASAVIVGDIKSKTVQINNGATIEGRCSQCYADVDPISIFDKKMK